MPVGALYGRLLYKAWKQRWSSGTTPTTYRYTGQRSESSLGLYFYGARWYDPYLSRWTSPDPIIPGVGESGNANAVGCLGAANYSPLTVDYHENQFLEQLNKDNKTRLQDSNYRLPPVPTNTIAFDRYTYSLNNPVRYTDPNGHNPILAALALIGPPGWVVLGVTAVGVGLYFAVPGVREAVTYGMYQAGEFASNGLNTLFAKGEYVPPGLGEGTAERAAYREALHKYKDAYNLGATDRVEKWILDKMAELAKKGVKPNDIVDQLPQPPEEDYEDEGE